MFSAGIGCKITLRKCPLFLWIRWHSLVQSFFCWAIVSGDAILDDLQTMASL